MAVPKGWVHTTKDYLTQLVRDWQTAHSLTGTVYEELGPQLSGTITAPTMYILELDGYPHFDSDNVLLVGFRITWKYIEIDWNEALEQLTDTLYSLTDYIYKGVHYVQPSIGGVRPPWIACEIDVPDFPEIYDKRKGYLNNQVNLDMVFRVAVTRRGWEFPQRFV